MPYWLKRLLIRLHLRKKLVPLPAWMVGEVWSPRTTPLASMSADATGYLEVANPHRYPVGTILQNTSGGSYSIDMVVVEGFVMKVRHLLPCRFTWLPGDDVIVVGVQGRDDILES